MNSLFDSARAAEIEVLEQIFCNQGPDIIGLYGIAGVGKSTLVNRLIELHPNECIKINCQMIEPTPKALTDQLKKLLHACDPDLRSITDSIKSSTVLILDQFESLNLVETWLRRDLMPSMQGRLKLIFCGRLRPDSQWVLNPPSNLTFRCLRLESLSFTHSIRFLLSQGHSEAAAMGINQFANGHPLALKLASSAMLEHPTRKLNEIPPNDVIQTLVRYFAEDIKGSDLRLALEATSMVRRISESLLSAMLDVDISSSHELYEQLSKIDFIESREDGLSLHEVLKNVISSNLRSRCPSTYCEYRNRACQVLLKEMKSASTSQYWRYTADILYLVDNKVIKSAFFPLDDHRTYSVEPAQKGDKESVMKIIGLHEPNSLIDIYTLWWTRHINYFHCVKDDTNNIVGFYILIKPDEVSPRILLSDPVTAQWYHHMQTYSDEHDYATQSIFIRRWLSVKEGESLSGVQAACWLDIKRTYVEMRPELRTVYLTLTDLQPYAQIATELGFQVLDFDINIDHYLFHTAFLDMGPDSVDGWISKKLVHEIHEQRGSIDYPEWFDKQARLLKFGVQRINLTPLELETLDFLLINREVAVSRKELLKEIWGIQYEGSSNVVDTIILSLRKKLGKSSYVIQSVRGVGYRYSDESS